MRAPIAVEIYTVRDAADRDFAAALERIAAIGYLGVELVGLHGMKPANFLAEIERLDLEVIGATVAGPDEEEELEKYYGEAVEVGVSVVHTMMDEQHFQTPDAVRRAAELCNRFGARARGDGVELLYHNHWWETTPRADGSVPLLELAAELDGVGILADVYWVAAGGIDVAATLEELGPKVRRLHVKDGHLKPGPVDITEPMTAVGDGRVDIPAAIAAAPQVDWHVVELDEYDGDPFDALERSYGYLTGNGLSRGRSS
ncbi:MAG: sugar phosphate isomerase/epimerase [Solirubrobacterales bacterium]